MDPPGCTLILLQQWGPRRELIATSLWEPTGWAGKKCGAAGSLQFTRQPESLLLIFPLDFRVRVFHFVTLLHVSLHVVSFVTVALIGMLLSSLFQFEEHWGMLASCACLGGVAVLAHTLKQAHYERQ